MDVIEALNTRYSCRDFEDKEVPKEILEKIIKAALRTPSWQNSQPWNVYVAGYETSKRIIRESTNPMTRGEMGLEVGHSGAWSMETMQRIRECMKDIQVCCPNNDMRIFGALNSELFHAPAMVFITMDSGLGVWSVYDIGAFSQSVMLAAQEYGIQSIPAVAYVNRPNVIRRVLSIPEDQIVVIGIGLGYEKKDASINKVRTKRKGLDEVKFFD